MIRRPPRSTRTDTLFPYTTLFRSQVLEAASGYEDRGAQAADDILCRLGPPDARELQVPAHILRDRAFATHHLERGGVLEPQMVEVGADPHLGRQVEGGARADEDGARIFEIRLPLLLRRAQRIEDAVAAVDRHRATAAREGDGLANPVAGVGAAEDRIFEDRVEAAFGVVVGIAVAGRIKARQAKAHPVVIVAELGDRKSTRVNSSK